MKVDTVEKALHKAEKTLGAAENTFDEMEKAIAEMEATLEKLDKAIEKKEEKLDGKDHDITVKRKTIGSLDKTIVMKKETIASLDKTIEEKTDDLHDLEATIESMDKVLDEEFPDPNSLERRFFDACFRKVARDEDDLNEAPAQVGDGTRLSDTTQPPISPSVSQISGPAKSQMEYQQRHLASARSATSITSTPIQPSKASVEPIELVNITAQIATVQKTLEGTISSLRKEARQRENSRLDAEKRITGLVKNCVVAENKAKGLDSQRRNAEYRVKTLQSRNSELERRYAGVNKDACSKDLRIFLNLVGYAFLVCVFARVYTGPPHW